MRKMTLVAGVVALTAVGAFSQTSRTHDLKLVPANVHWGYYDAAVKPVLRVASGDTVRQIARTPN